MLTSPNLTTSAFVVGKNPLVNVENVENMWVFQTASLDYCEEIGPYIK